MKNHFKTAKLITNQEGSFLDKNYFKLERPKSHTILVSAILVFMLAIFFLIGLIFSLEMTIQDYKKSIGSLVHVQEIQENFEELELEHLRINLNSINTPITSMFGQKNNITNSLSHLKKELSSNSVQSINIELAQSQWKEIERGNSSTEQKKIFLSTLDTISKKEKDKIYLQGPDLEKNISNLVPITLIVATLTIFLLIYSFFMLLIENQAKLKLLKELEVARAQAVMASGLKSKFLTTVSHEIRTPLNGIIGISNLLLTNKSLRVEDNYIETIYNSGKTLLKLISNILDFSKIESGAIVFEKNLFSLKKPLPVWWTI